MALINYTVRNEIQQYLDQNHISCERLGLVNIRHWQDIERRAIDAFVDRTANRRENLHWISLNGQFSDKAEIIAAYDTREDRDWVLHLSEIIPDEKAYFFVEDSYEKMWIYEGFVSEISRLLHEGIYLDEYCIADKKYRWLICFNHHEVALFVQQKGDTQTELNLNAIRQLTQKED